MGTKRGGGSYGRSRERVIPEAPIPAHTYTYEDNYGNSTETLVRTSASCSRREVMSDVVTANFRSRSADGEVIVNPMTKTMTTTEAVPGSSWATHTDPGYQPKAYTGTYTHTGVVDYLTWPVGEWDFIPLAQSGATADVAIVKAYADANGQAMQLLVELAESGKTVKTVAGILMDLVKVAHSLSVSLTPRGIARLRKQGRKVLTLPGALAAGKRGVAETTEQYLRYRYGILPLVRGIEDARDAIRQVLDRPVRVTGRGSSEESAEVVSERPVAAYYWGVPQCAGTNTFTTRSVHKCTHRAGVMLEYTPSINRVLGTDLVALPSAAYELVPYSFVVDQFVAIGDWILAHSINPTFKNVGSWCVSTDTRSLSHAFSATGGRYVDSSNRSWEQSGWTSNHIKHSESKRRTVSPPLPILPPVKQTSLTLTNALDDLALAVSAVRRL